VLTLLFGGAGTAMCWVLARAARRAGTRRRIDVPGPSGSWRLPSGVRRRLGRALHDADVDKVPEEIVELWGIAIGVIAIVGVGIAPVLLVPGVLGVTAAGPIGLLLARARRERRFAEALPRALEQIASELRGAGTVTSALEQIARGNGAVASDVRRIVNRVHLGSPIADALAAWTTEHDVPGVRAVAGALAVATAMGGSATEAIEGLAGSLRARLDAAAEARALSSQARLSALVIGAAPIGYLLFSSLVDPRSVTLLLTTGIGRVCLVVGLGLEALAALWIRRIVASEA
jgi:tight adherence protein B